MSESEDDFVIEDEYDVCPDSSASTSPLNLVNSHSQSSDVYDIEKDLTQKFLNGEISFEEYSSKWNDKSSYDYDVTDRPTEASLDLASKTSIAASEVGVKRRRRTHLSAALTGLMGEANLRFVRGDRETAEKMCHEIIRQVPTSHEPYQTLAQIYEHDADKYLQYSLLAAHLSPPDADEWLRLATISKERGEFKQEMICYTQAVKADPRNLSIHLKRIEFFKRADETNMQLHRLTYQACYHKIVRCLAPSEYVTILDYAKRAASLYHETNELEKALEVMKDAYDKCASRFTMEELNLFLELLISQKEYKEAVEVLISNTGVEVEAIVETLSNGETTHDQTQYVACHIPSELPIDLKTKLLISFIHLKSNELVQELVTEFIQNDVEKMGDLFMDVEEALSSVGEYALAIRLLDLLVNSHHFSLGAVWLRHAECLIHLGRKSEAIVSLQKVIELAPQHVEARRKLFSILEKKEHQIGAIHVLEQDHTKPINSKLMHEYCQVLKEQKNFEKYLQVGETLLSRTFMKFRHPEELKMARLNRHALQAIYNFRLERDEDPYDADALTFDEEILSPDEEWQLLQELLDVAFQVGNYTAMQRLTFGAYLSKLIPTHRQEIDFQCLQACLLKKDYRNAYFISKELTYKFPEYPRTWNIFSFVQQVDDDQNHTKSLLRLYTKFKDKSHHITMFVGNAYLLSGRYQSALSYYLDYHERESKDPIAALMIGITMLTMACQKVVDKHHGMILQGISYMMKYKELRKYDQEAYYNIGRACHMLSLHSLAVHYYKKALSAPSIECERHDQISMKREAAYNLFQIYKASSPQLARMILQQYLVI